ncbi:MAG: metallophosphoesterase [Planctomycetes bacterium]|nr:metallophosphoesterase [Planctomycetota bacterium]
MNHAPCKGVNAPRKLRLSLLLAVMTMAVMTCMLTGCQAFSDRLHGRDKTFTVVLIPDTQNYTDSSFDGDPQLFYDQTRWIKTHQKRLNIVMVAHAGDIVQNPEEASEWDIADRAFTTIDRHVPYILCLGNHDITDDRDTLLNSTFPPSRFVDNPVYSPHFGADPQTHFMEPGKSDNYYLYFEGAGARFLIIALEFKPRDETLRWAGQVIEAHPDRRCVVLTHGYLNTEGARHMGNYALPGNQSSDIWTKLVSQHPNIFLVLCGHALGEAVLTSTGQAGNRVQQVLADYQNDYVGRGGSGYLRIMTFCPARKEIRHQTYSPSLDKYLTRPESQFTLTYD